MALFDEKLSEKLEWKYMPTFVPNKHLPVYNWLYYKEGYSRELVMYLLDHFAVAGGDTVLDPFCGSGTTLLACKEQHVASIGFDVLPVAVFASRVKTRNYNKSVLKRAIDAVMKKKFKKTDKPFPALMQRAFSKYGREDIAFFQDALEAVEDAKTKDFLSLALANAAVKASMTMKDGAVIKIVKKHVPPLRYAFKRIAYRMLREAMISGPEARVEAVDARELPLDNESIDAVITSPPYLNNIDYTRAYALENFFVPSTKGTFIGHKNERDDTRALPQSADAYFHDMQCVISELCRVMKPGGKASIVVGNAYYPGLVVESDRRLAEIAETCGLALDHVIVLNKRYALSSRTHQKGLLRESLILLTKPV